MIQRVWNKDCAYLTKVRSYWNNHKVKLDFFKIILTLIYFVCKEQKNNDAKIRNATMSFPTLTGFDTI